MNALVAALPMYDWPQARRETDAAWAWLRDRLRDEGIAAPERLARRNADLPPVPGGIRCAKGPPLAPDPATLPPETLDLDVLWRHPHLLFAQTCWGPMEAGLQAQVQIVGQPDYSAYEGGERAFYSSAILMRKGTVPAGDGDVAAPGDGRPIVPARLMHGKRFAYNERRSMSGFLALSRDVDALGIDASPVAQGLETGSHRASAMAVAEGDADYCAVDCRTWSLIRRFLPFAEDLTVVGWTARRKGLPYITASSTPPEHVAILRRLVSSMVSR